MRARSSTDEATEKADPRWFAGLAGDLAGTADDRPPLVFLHGSFRVELLPPEARMQVESTSRPEPDLVRSYWQELLTTPPEQLQASVTAAMRQIADADVPYLLILGAEPRPRLGQSSRPAFRAQPCRCGPIAATSPTSPTRAGSPSSLLPRLNGRCR